MKKCLIEKWNNQCCYCGYTQKHKELTIDHVIPISKGGNDSYENQVPCCRLCNLSKGDKAVRQWYFDRDEYSTERWNKIKLHMTRVEDNVFAA